MIKRGADKLWRSLRLSIGRAVLTLIDDATMMQTVQMEGLPGEVLDGVERIQQYGFTSRPHAGAEAVFLALGGQRQHSIVIACEDRRYRVTGLETGEVCIYTDEDQDGTPHRIHFKRGRGIELRAGASSIVMTPTEILLNAAHIGLND